MSTTEMHAFSRTSSARVLTERPARYGKQLAGHMGRKITAVWDEESATGSVPAQGVTGVRMARTSSKKTRRSVPSWDEILFGSKS